MEASYSIIQGGSEYRVLLAPANLDALSDGLLHVLSDFIHLIARDRHSDIVEMLKGEIKDVSGK